MAVFYRISVICKKYAKIL